MTLPTLLLVADEVRQVRSGVGTYGRLLLRGLIERGLSPVVATWEAERDPGGFPELEWISLGKRPRLDPTPGAFLSLGRRIGPALAGRDFGLIHFLDARGAHAFLPADGPAGAKVIGTVHDDYAARAPASAFGLFGRAADPLRRWLYYRWLARLEARTYPRLELLMTNARATSTSLVERYGIARELLREIPLTIHVPEPCGAATPLEGEPALLFSGGNFYRKGLDLLLRAAGSLQSRLPGIHVHVAGEDRARSRIAALAGKAGMRERLSFHGRLAPADMARMLRGADQFVMPSRREALGLVYLEAFHAGIPVIAGSEGGVAELVGDEASGLLVPREDVPALAHAIERLWLDAELAARLVAGGRRVLAARSVDRFLDATLAAYRSMGVVPAGSLVAGPSREGRLESSSSRPAGSSS
ncbi:MAG: glycosyltransferase family 4 protein [Planctomycetota bacterium]